MYFKPAQLGLARLDDVSLKEDKTACKKYGPCGLGKKAIYLNSFYIDRRYYLPLASVQRVYKRLSMSKGAFTGKGVFGSLPYLVVEYDNGQEKQCNFKYEQNVDLLLAALNETHPEIKTVSASAERRLAEAAREKASRVKKNLSDAEKAEIAKLEAAKTELSAENELCIRLAAASKAKRVNDRTNPAHKWVALAVTVAGLILAAAGAWSMVNKVGSFGIYFLLIGLAIIFLFSGASVLPTMRNNKKRVTAELDAVTAKLEIFLQAHPSIPLPARYAHPMVLSRMCLAIREGRAQDAATALEALKTELKGMNASVQVSQEDYDEIVTIKPMFLIHDYQ